MRYAAILAAAVLAAASARARAGEMVVKAADLPAAVQRTVEQQSQGAKLRRIIKDGKGRGSFDLELTVAGHGKIVSVDNDGNVFQVEEEVDLVNLPAGAKSALEKAAGGGKIVRIAALSHNGPIEVYTADIKNGKTKSSTRVDPSGNEVAAP